MDFQLKDEVDLSKLPERLTSVMPEGIVIHEAYPMENKAKFLKWLRVTARLEYDDRDLEEMAAGLTEFYAKDSIVITRKTKRGEGESDIVPAIQSLQVKAGEKQVDLEAVISAQEPTLNPDHLIAALRQLKPELAPDFAAFTRRELYFENGEVFR